MKNIKAFLTFSLEDSLLFLMSLHLENIESSQNENNSA